jgi:hypothetical protein
MLIAAPAQAKEFNVFGGFLQNTADHEHTYTWQLEYRQQFQENFAFSITYLNEGAFPVHSRDGHAAQLWARLPLADNRLALGLGAGPYFYYDTIPYSSSGYSLNDHGWGALVTGCDTLHPQSLASLRGAIGQQPKQHRHGLRLLGVGYRLGDVLPFTELK